MLQENEHYAAEIDDAFKCYYSERGCFKIPIRMVGILSEASERGAAIVDAVMLCRDHAATFQPSGNVIFDKLIVEDETLTFLTKNGI